MKIKNYDEVQKAITAKVGELQCPMCKSVSIQLEDEEHYRISYMREGENLVHAQNINARSYITLRCHHCGYLMDFALADVMDDPEYPKK